MRHALLLILLLSSSAYGNSLSGHFKSQGMVNTDAPSNSLNQYLWNNQVAVKGFYDLTEKLLFEGAYQLDLAQARTYSPIDQSTGNKLPYRVFDADLDPYNKSNSSGNSLALFQNLNKFNLSYSKEKYELILGRQSVSFGNGRVVSPMDIWAPFGISEIDTEDRLGIDSLRLKIALDEMGQLDTGIVISDSDDKERLHGFVDLKVSRRGVDYEFNLSRFHRNHLAAIGLQGDLLGAGVWGELAYNLMDEKKNYLRSSVGAEYSFTSLFMGNLEYHFNGAGQSDSELYLTDLASNDGYTEGAVFFLGESYLIPGISWTFHPLASLAANVIINLNDMSQYYSLKVEYNVAEDLYLDGGVYISGSSGEQSEYGRYSDSLYGSFRSYF